MTKRILDLTRAPQDPIERIIYLDGVLAQVREELEVEFAAAYFEARVQRRFLDALGVGRASRKRALAWTRAENNRNGRAVRWQDGLDPTSTDYAG